MWTDSEPVSDDVIAAIRAELEARMTPYGFRDFTVRTQPGFVGDVIRVDAQYDLTETPVPIEAISALRTMIQMQVRALDDPRVVLITNHFHDDQPIDDSILKKRRKIDVGANQKKPRSPRRRKNSAEQQPQPA